MTDTAVGGSESGYQQHGTRSRRAALKPPGPLQRLAWTGTDTVAIAHRNLLTFMRTPQLVIFMFVQPVLFVVMFNYVLGSAIQIPGMPRGNYPDYLMPGIFAQTVVFGATGSGVSLAEDMNRGLVDRLRSLPMARSAVLGGRALADLARNVVSTVLMVVVGFVVGMRVHTGVVPFLGGLFVLLVFGLALSWLFILLGMLAGNGETAQAMCLPLVVPLTFASSAFVPVANMPGWLQVFAEHQPVTAAINAMRACANGGATLGPVLTSLVWSVVVVAVFAPLAVRRYRRLT